MVWEAVFLLIVLKIPIAYLCLVVWWAIRAEPRPEQGAESVARVSPTDGGSCDWPGGGRHVPVRWRRPLRPVEGRSRAAFGRAEGQR